MQQKVFKAHHSSSASETEDKTRASRARRTALGIALGAQGFPPACWHRAASSRGHKRNLPSLQGRRTWWSRKCVSAEEKVTAAPPPSHCRGYARTRWEGRGATKQSLFMYTPPHPSVECLSQLLPCCCRMAWDALQPLPVPVQEQHQGPGWVQRAVN